LKREVAINIAQAHIAPLVIGYESNQSLLSSLQSTTKQTAQTHEIDYRSSTSQNFHDRHCMTLTFDPVTLKIDRCHVTCKAGTDKPTSTQTTQLTVTN